MNNSETKTKARTFKLELSEADVEKLFYKAGAVGLTPEQLLENFIADLVCGERTNGSDERMYAEAWFDRCGFAYMKERTLLNYLIDNSYNIVEFLVLHSSMNDENVTCSQMAYDEYNEIVEGYIKWSKRPNPDIEKEVDNVVDWYANYQNKINE